MSDIKSLTERAYSHYRQHGIKSLARTTVLYLSEQFVQPRTLSTAELEDLAQTRGSLWYANQEEQVKIQPPDHPYLRTAFADYPKIYHPKQAFVCELPGCHLFGQGAAGLYRGERLLLDTTRNKPSTRYFDSYPRLAMHAVRSRLGMDPEFIEETTFPIICLDSSYYHWLLEFLPKLRFLELYQKKTGRMPTLVIESNPRDFVVETLKFAGYGPEQYLEWDQMPRVVERLVTVPHREHRFDYEHPPNSRYQPSQVDLKWLRSHMRSQMPDDLIDTSANRRIYISRQHAERGRAIVNSDTVFRVLQERGFESHVLEDYPFRKQMQLFMEADVIAGPHGAGLANMLFADDPVVIELLPEKFVKPHFYFLASIMGFEYEGVVTGAVGNNLRVDISCLQRRLDSIGI